MDYIIVVAIIVIAMGRGLDVAALALTVVEQVAVATDVIGDLVEDGIEALPFPLLKRSTLGYQAY